MTMYATGLCKLQILGIIERWPYELHIPKNLLGAYLYPGFLVRVLENNLFSSAQP